MLLSVFSIQGTAFLSQFILAGLLPTESFSIVRTVEATIQMISAVAPWGMSLLVIRLASQNVASNELRRLFTTYVMFAGTAALFIASLGFLIVLCRHVRMEGYLSVLIWIIVLTSLSRTSLNYYYGKEQFGLIATITFIISIISLVMLVFFTSKWHLDGWIFSRYLTEIIVLIAALYFVKSNLTLKFLTIAESKNVLIEGMAVSLSLIFRSAIDNFPFLIFAYLSVNQTEIAMYGLCTLLISGAMIFPSSIISVLLPRYGNLQKNQPQELINVHTRYERYVLLSSLVVMLLLVALVFCSPYYLENQKYNGIFPYLMLAATIVPIRAYTTLNANVLFVNRQTAIGTKINFACAMICGLLSYSLYIAYGLWGIIIASLSTEIATLIIFKSYSKQINQQISKVA